MSSTRRVADAPAQGHFNSGHQRTRSRYVRRFNEVTTTTPSLAVVHALHAPQAAVADETWLTQATDKLAKFNAVAAFYELSQDENNLPTLLLMQAQGAAWSTERLQQAWDTMSQAIATHEQIKRGIPVEEHRSYVVQMCYEAGDISTARRVDVAVKEMSGVMIRRKVIDVERYEEFYLSFSEPGRYPEYYTPIQASRVEPPVTAGGAPVEISTQAWPKTFRERKAERYQRVRPGVFEPLRLLRLV